MERRVLKLISEGYSTHQISHAIGVNLHLVYIYRRSLLAKSDARNSSELILKAVQANIIKVSPLGN
jgi:DNA-binding CsgD family transcriptional regulator